jgi:molecular chaperone GrpE
LVEALLILIVVCIAAIVWYSVSSRRRIARLEQESQERLGEMRSEHDKRVDRLHRKFDAVSERGHLDFAADLLPALDALGHALKEAQKSDELGGVREGLEMVDRELDTILSKHGIEKCSPEPGDAFDAKVHEAVAIVDSDELEPNCVAECFRPGYVHDERVLRSAAVSVTAKAEAQADVSSADDVIDGPGADVSSSRL